MLSSSQQYYGVSWWLPLIPGLAIFFTISAYNFLGDSLRDVLDPNIKTS